MRLLGRLARDTRGNVAMISAICLIVLAMIVGAAVDLSRMLSSKTRLQDSTDAAVLAAAKAYYTSTGTIVERKALGKTAADSSMNAVVANFSATLISPTWVLTIDEKKGTVTLVSSSASPAAFGGLFGVKTLPFTVDAMAMGGSPRLEVALVLDNTGSMEEGDKIGLLKVAAADLVDTLASASKNSSMKDPLKIALVPFSTTVRVDAATYQNAAWLDTAGAAPYANEHLQGKIKTRFEAFKAMKSSWAGCLERRPASGDYDADEKPPTGKDSKSLYEPYFAPDEPDMFGAFNNYLDDSSGGNWKNRQDHSNKYEDDATPRTGSIPFHPLGYDYGPNSGCELAPVARLTADAAAIKTAIGKMTAIGNTDIGIGLAWGWNVLSPNAPFADGQAYGTKDLNKIVILMTDGNNESMVIGNENESIYSGASYIPDDRVGTTTNNQSQRNKAFDDRLSLLCTNMKKKGIILYTMRVEVKGGSSQVLSDCASDPAKFFDVQDADDMNKVFDQIAASILELRLSR